MDTITVAVTKQILEDLGHFVETAVGELITCPHQIDETKIAVKLWLTYTPCYILSLAIKFQVRLLALFWKMFLKMLLIFVPFGAQKL